MPPRLFGLLLEEMVASGEIALGDSSVRLAHHQVTFDPAQRQKVGELMARLSSSRYSPPSLGDLAQELGLGAEAIGALVEQGRIVRVSDSIAFLPEAYDEIVGKIVERIRLNGSITVGEVRDLFDTSRKYSLALMEHLDQTRVTRRVGDARVLR
jgi:selenocysteine-specific elongation factor